MVDRVYIDEKWFNMYKDNQVYYLLPEEDDVHRTTQSKKFISKVMFLVAVAKPRYDFSKNMWFDGKIELWPFVEKTPAKRPSEKRAAGTLKTKCINVTKVEYAKILIEKVLPAIKSKWRGRKKKILIQYDNARLQMMDGISHWSANRQTILI